MRKSRFVTSSRAQIFVVGLLSALTQCARGSTSFRSPITHVAQPQATALAVVHLSPNFDLTHIADFEQLRVRCAANNLPSCATLAQHYESGIGIDRNNRVALDLFNHACLAGHLPSCVQQGRMQLGDRYRETLDLGRQRLATLCAQQQLDACGILAQAVASGVGGAIDLPQARQLSESGCPSTTASLGCATWALLRRDAHREDPRVIERARLSCDQHIAVGCRALGLIASAQNQREQSARWWTQACDDSDAKSCALLAGQVHDTEPARAQTLWTRACVELTPAAGCAEWADSRRSSLSPAERRELLDVSCSVDSNPTACLELAQVMAHRGIFDNDEVAALVQLTCSDTDDRGCAILAQVEAARGSDRALIESLYRRGCDHGDASGCTQFGSWLLAQSRLGDAISVWARACREHDAPACLHLAESYNPGPHPSSNAPRNARARTYQWAMMGCSLGNAPSCELASHVASTTRETRLLRARACHLGDSDSCDRQ